MAKRFAVPNHQHLSVSSPVKDLQLKRGRMVLDGEQQKSRAFPSDGQAGNDVANRADTIAAGRRSRKPSRSSSQRHGLTRLKAAVRGLGSRVIDRRTTLGKALVEWRQELIKDLGGPDAVSTQVRAIVDLAVRTKLLLDSVDAWLLTQPSLVNKRARALLPVVRERQQLADGLARYLTMLGLERRQRTLSFVQAIEAAPDLASVNDHASRRARRTPKSAS